MGHERTKWGTVSGTRQRAQSGEGARWKRYKYELRTKWAVRSCVSTLHCGRLKSSYIRATALDGLGLSKRARRRWRGDVDHSASQRSLNSFALAANTTALLVGRGESNAGMREARTEKAPWAASFTEE